MSNILALGEYTGTLTIERDADVLESLGYYAPVTGSPVTLSGVVINLTVRTSLTGPVIYYGSTVTGEIQILPSSPIDPTTNVWAWVVYRANFPAFLTPRSTPYFFNVQAVADGLTKTIMSGDLYVVTKGAPG